MANGFKRSSRPSKETSVIVSTERPKTAALGFETVLSPSNDVPEELAIIRFNNNTLKGITFSIDYPPLPGTLYQNEDHGFILTRLTEIALPDEDVLRWDQVLEFRKDYDSVAKYRRLAHWFDSELVGKSEAFIVEDLQLKLKDYESVIKKHGFKTIVGVLSKLLDMDSLTAVGTTIGGLSLAGLPDIAVAAGASVFMGKCALEVAKARIDSEEVRTSHHHGAFLHDLKRLNPVP